MPIESITGKPGNAKTAFLVKRILQESQKPADQMRPLWATGIDGLQPGLCNVFKDPREWNAVRPGETCTCSDTENSEPCDAHVIPNGSLIFIDEAWKWFGHLQDASRQSTPKHVLQLAEHRHRGLDFVWTYQQPSQIFPFARGLMAEHRHLVRKFGTMFCDAYDWQELCEDVKSPSKREAAQKSVVAIPKETFGMYKSAEVHTIKRKIPFKVLALPVLALAAITCGWLAYSAMKPDAMAARLGAEGEAPGQPGAPASRRGSGGTPAYSTAQEYARMFTARIQAMPWTAPGYDGRQVKSEPRVWCVLAGAGEDAMGTHRGASCSCKTEQGTPYAMDRQQCEIVATTGEPYNPFREPAKDRERSMEPAGGGGVSPPATGASSAAPVATRQGSPGIQQADYGGFRSGG